MSYEDVRIMVPKDNIIRNTGKTAAMSFHTKQNRFPITPKVTFRNMDIAYKSGTKFLGIHITKNLKCNVRVCPLSLQLSEVSCFIKPLNKSMSSCMIRIIYHLKKL